MTSLIKKGLVVTKSAYKPLYCLSSDKMEVGKQAYKIAKEFYYKLLDEEKIPY